jgi:hypothetical protein
VRSAGVVLIDAGTIKSMFAFPAYVYLAVVAVITFLGAILFLLLLVVDLSLAKGSSEHESIRFKIDNNIPFVALCFDFIFLVLSMTSACATLGLTNVMRSNLTLANQESAKEIVVTIFNLKYAAAACMISQSIFIAATLVLGWQHVEGRRKMMAQLGIPPQATQQNIDKVFHFWSEISSGLGKRSEDRAAISPLFLNRIVQVFLSLAAFVCCYILVFDEGVGMEAAFDDVPPFQVITWVSLAILITSFGIVAVSGIDLSLTGGINKDQGVYVMWCVCFIHLPFVFCLNSSEYGLRRNATNTDRLTTIPFHM